MKGSIPRLANPLGAGDTQGAQPGSCCMPWPRDIGLGMATMDGPRAPTPHGEHPALDDTHDEPRASRIANARESAVDAAKRKVGEVRPDWGDVG